MKKIILLLFLIQTSANAFYETVLNQNLVQQDSYIIAYSEECYDGYISGISFTTRTGSAGQAEKMCLRITSLGRSYETTSSFECLH